MRYLRVLALMGLFLIPAGFAQAQHVSVGIGVGPVYAGPAYVGPVGPPPACAYGYYPYAPYACAPDGYYGPSWFVNGVFIGAGPWYHAYWGRPGYWGRDWDDHAWHRDWDDHGWHRDWDRGRGSEGFRGGDHGRDFHGGNFHGGAVVHGHANFHREGSFHGGGGFHGGGSHGGRGGFHSGGHGGGRR
jgi:hypothetical protein